MANCLDKEKLQQIKELLNDCSKEFGHEAWYYESECMQCSGNCKDCYQPLREMQKKCWNAMDYIEELLDER